MSRAPRDGLLARVYLGILLSALSLNTALVSGAPQKSDSSVEGNGDTISHSLGLVARLEGLLVQGNSSDVVLRVETLNSDEVKVIAAHSLVLSLQSEVFEELLQSRNGSTLVLKESAKCAAVFDRFIRYLYCGELYLHLEQATPLHKLATKYRVAGLRQGLTQYMRQNLASESPGGHVVGWYQYATQTGDATLRASCLQYLSWNMSSMLQSAEWPSVSAELLLTLLTRSDLVLQSETELFEALEAWIARNDPNGLTAENALRAVRYAMIPPRELFRLQRQSPMLARYHELVRDLLYMSYQFHSASPLQLAKYVDVNCSLFVPRNYLAPAWGTPWIISNPARDDCSTSFQTQLGPSGHDASKWVTWKALFSPRWLPLSMRPLYTEQGATQTPQAEAIAGAGRPCVIITPATSSTDFAGVTFQKTVVVVAWQQGRMVVRHVYNFHQSSEETGDFLAEDELQRRTSDYLVDGSLYLHIIVKPLYQTLITTKK